jgi:hypothetical protein
MPGRAGLVICNFESPPRSENANFLEQVAERIGLDFWMSPPVGPDRVPRRTRGLFDIPRLDRVFSS